MHPAGTDNSPRRWPLTWLAALALTGPFWAVGVGCSQAKWHEVQALPATGQRFFVDPERAHAKGSPGSPERPDCVLDRNQGVQVVHPPSDGSSLVEVSLTDAPASLAGAEECQPPLYVPVSDLRTDRSPVNPADRFYAVLNVATEKLRVYEICRAAGCRGNRLVLETEMLAGPDLPNRRTWLGEYRILAWRKFYADHEGKYPAFDRAGYPALPEAGAPLESWLSQSLLPGGRGEQRGAFGWYTAQLGPDANAQWLQGTWGHGADGDRFIRLVRNLQDRGASAHGGLDPFSHGCTRVDNPTVAYLKHLLPERTVVLRVYARERLLADAGDAAARTWKWSIEKSGGGLLDEGTLAIGATAHASNGNPYGVADSDLHGVFNVDDGTFENYRHPETLDVGGYRDRTTPGFARRRGLVSASLGR